MAGAINTSQGVSKLAFPLAFSLGRWDARASFALGGTRDLAIVITPPARNGTRGREGTTVVSARAHRSEGAGGSVGDLGIAIIAPADHEARGVDGTAVVCATAQSGKSTGGRGGLPKVALPPTSDEPGGIEGTVVVLSDAQGRVTACEGHPGHAPNIDLGLVAVPIEESLPLLPRPLQRFPPPV